MAHRYDSTHQPRTTVTLNASRYFDLICTKVEIRHSSVAGRHLCHLKLTIF